VLLQGAGFRDFVPQQVILIRFRTVLLGLGLAVVNRSLRIARRDGTLLPD